jgi:hypothetical protein
MNSPFETVFAGTSLPPAFEKQYMISVDSGQMALFDGVSARVWHRPFWLWPIFWAMSPFDILFPETGTDIPATMKLTGGRDAQGQPYHNWDRTFFFAKPRYFKAVMAYDLEQQCVIEHFTPMHLLNMVWEISFTAPAHLEIVTRACRIKLGKLQITLPSLLHPHVHVIEDAISDDTIQMSLVMSHPFLGDIFGYAGTYHVAVAESN